MLRDSIRRRRSAGDDGFAMAVALLFLLMVGVTSVAVSAMAIGDQQPTRVATSSAQSLTAATSGLESALSALRDATATTSGAARGDLGSLPCNLAAAGQLSGTTSAAAGARRYTVTISYYATDPSLAGHGPAQACPLLVQPAFALLDAYGYPADQPGSQNVALTRHLHEVYEFATSTARVTGGSVQAFAGTGSSGSGLCWDAGTKPQAGTVVTFRTCAQPTSAEQTFTYRTDLSLAFTGTPALGLCLQAATSVTLQPCATDGDASTYPYASTAAQQQEFGLDDYNHFESAASGGGLSGKCLVPSSTPALVGSNLVLGTCDASTTSSQAVLVDSKVGHGAAGTSDGTLGGDGQLASYNDASECMDVTNQDVTAGYLIIYPCKQDPDPSKISWNQRFTFVPGTSAAVGTIQVTAPSGTYCLQNGSTFAGTVAAGTTLVSVAKCVASLPAQQWSFTGTTTADPYTFTSGGQCLSSGLQQSGMPYDTVVLAACDGTGREQWNSPPQNAGTLVGDLQEDPLG